MQAVMGESMDDQDMRDEDYRRLARFRRELRLFLRFSGKDAVRLAKADESADGLDEDPHPVPLQPAGEHGA